MKTVIRTEPYQDDLEQIEAEIAKSNPAAGLDMWLHIDGQVDKLADPNFPRKIGRVKGTFELVAHPNYIVFIEEDETSVTVLNVNHTRRQWPR